MPTTKLPLRGYSRALARLMSVDWDKQNGLTVCEAWAAVQEHLHRLSHFDGSTYQQKAEQARLQARSVIYQTIEEASRRYGLARHVGAEAVPARYLHLRHACASYLIWELSELKDNPWEPLINLIRMGGKPVQLALDSVKVRHGTETWPLSFSPAA